MKYYDSTSGKVRDTMGGTFIDNTPTQTAKNIRSILTIITLILMAITVLFQILWFNILLHTILCMTIIALSACMIICDVIQKDMKSVVHPVGWLTFWLTNLIINLIKYFLA